MGHIQTFLGRHTEGEALAHYKTFIAPHCTTDGQADLAVGRRAIAAVSAELGVPATVTATDFYRTAITTHEHPESGITSTTMDLRSTALIGASRRKCTRVASELVQSCRTARKKWARTAGFIA